MDIVFRRRLLEKKVLKGIMLTVGEQAIVEALSQVGFDWLLWKPNTRQIWLIDSIKLF